LYVLIGFGNTGTSNVFGAQNSIFGKPQQTTPAFGTQTSTQAFGMNTAQPNIFGSNTAQTAKPFGGNFQNKNRYILNQIKLINYLIIINNEERYV